MVSRFFYDCRITDPLVKKSADREGNLNSTPDRRHQICRARPYRKALCHVHLTAVQTLEK